MEITLLDVTMSKERIKEFINDQMSQADFRARAYVFDRNNKKRPNRSIFVKIQSYCDKFLLKESDIRWITLTGLRGAGKTTILYQLYYAKRSVDAYRLILSGDQVVQILGSSLQEVLDIFEEIIGRSLSNLDKPLLLFVDEVQYDKQWGVVLKALYDKTNQVFIFSTGSAAVLMNTNADVARRTVFEKIFPLSFCEYLKIKNERFEKKGLSQKLRKIIFESVTVENLVSDLHLIEHEIDEYYLGTSRLEFQSYLYYGSLPFMIALENEAIVYDQIQKTIERVIAIDIPQLEGFSADIIGKIPAILYAVSDMDAFNFTTLGSRFGISRQTVSEIFSALEQTELLHRIYPHGSHFNQVTNKPSKYLFSSPAFRSMYYKMVGSSISEENARGRLLEDLVGMYLYRLVHQKVVTSLTYDSAQGGADFILGRGKEKLVIEVGVNKQGFKQVFKTGEKVGSRYNVVISERSDGIEFDMDSNSVRIPLRIFLLV